VTAVGGLLIALVGVLGQPAAPARASCAYVGPIPTVRDGQVLFVATVTQAVRSSAMVRVERWLVGPAQTGVILVRGSASDDFGISSSVDWEPVNGGTEVIAATLDELGILRTNLCSSTPLTPDAAAAIELAYGPGQSPIPAASPSGPPAWSPAPAAPPEPSEEPVRSDDMDVRAG